MARGIPALVKPALLVWARERSGVAIEEAAAKLKIPYQDAHRLLLTGRLRGEKRGGRWYVRVTDVERVIEERGQPAPTA